MVRWIDGDRFDLDGTTFLTMGDADFNDESFLAPFMRMESSADRFVVWKGRAAIDRYVQLVRDLDAKRIFELGILKGGSTAFLAALADPLKLVAVDVSTSEIDALKEFVDRRKLAERVKPYYGVDQGDRQALESILDAEFTDDALDLVVDDASHRLDLTRASFNVLFPRLRPGGTYVIEDWSWAHALHKADIGRLGPPLTNLVFEIVVACPTLRDVITSIEIEWGVAYITRGPAALGPDFDVSRPLATARESGVTSL